MSAQRKAAACLVVSWLVAWLGIVVSGWAGIAVILLAAVGCVVAIRRKGTRAAGYLILGTTWFMGFLTVEFVASGAPLWLLATFVATSALFFWRLRAYLK